MLHIFCTINPQPENYNNPQWQSQCILNHTVLYSKYFSTNDSTFREPRDKVFGETMTKLQLDNLLYNRFSVIQCAFVFGFFFSFILFEMEKILIFLLYWKQIFFSYKYPDYNVFSLHSSQLFSTSLPSRSIFYFSLEKNKVLRYNKQT